jgi:hypothetical protein
MKEYLDPQSTKELFGAVDYISNYCKQHLESSRSHGCKDCQLNGVTCGEGKFKSHSVNKPYKWRKNVKL